MGDRKKAAVKDSEKVVERDLEMVARWGTELALKLAEVMVESSV